MVLPRRNEEIKKMRMLELAAKESKSNRTLRDAERLSKNDSRAPPRTYSTLKSNIGYVCALLGVCYGKRCPAYIKIKELCRTIN